MKAGKDRRELGIELVKFQTRKSWIIRCSTPILCRGCLGLLVMPATISRVAFRFFKSHHARSLQRAEFLKPL